MKCLKLILPHSMHMHKYIKINKKEIHFLSEVFALNSYLTSIFPLPSQCKISVLSFPSPISVLKIILVCLSVLVSYMQLSVQFSCSVMSDSATPWTASCQASLSIAKSWSLLKLMSVESMMLSNHLILYAVLYWAYFSCIPFHNS